MWLSRAGVWLICISFVMPIAAVPADMPEAPQELPKTVAVAAFKNGLAFVVRQGNVRLQSGVGRVTPIPNATLGTLWLAPGESGTSLDEVVAYHYNVAGERNMASLSEVLQANAGKTVVVTYNMKDYIGEIVGPREPDAIGNLSATAPTASGTETSAGMVAASPAATPQYLLLRVDKKLVALPLSSITNAVLPEDTIFREKIERPHAALRFKIKSAGDKTSLTVGYLEHGLGWTPSYLISLTDDKTAQITMQAVVIDDAEDLKDATFSSSSEYPILPIPTLHLPWACSRIWSRSCRTRSGATRGGFVLITPSAVKWSLWTRIRAVIPALLRSRRRLRNFRALPRKICFFTRAQE